MKTNEDNNVVVQVRALKTKDFFKVATILSKLTKTSLKQLGNVETTEGNEQKTGLIFLSSALEHAESDVKAWLADLIDVDVETFDALPFDTSLIIVEQLAKKEDLTRFFTRVKSLMNKAELLH